MRLPWVSALLLFCASGLFSVSVSHKEKLALDRAVPANALALLILNDPAADLELALRVDLSQWISGDPQTLAESISEPLRTQIGGLLREDLEKALLVVHRLEKRESGAWKIHFSAILQPKRLRRQAVELRIAAAMAAAFGPQMQTAEAESVRAYRGSQPNQVLYQVRLPEFLLVSNTEEGRDDAIRSWIGRGPRLRERNGFKRIQSRLPIHRGVFFYCDCRRILPVFPEFGYQVQRRGNSVQDQSYIVGAGLERSGED